jgi:hypothetical protein
MSIEEIAAFIAAANDDDLQELMGQLKKSGRMYVPNWFFAQHFENYSGRKWTAEEISTFSSKWLGRFEIMDDASQSFDRNIQSFQNGEGPDVVVLQIE